MSIYSPKLYAKSIPKYIGPLDELVNSNSVMPIVPGMGSGKVKNLRSLPIKSLLNYLGDSSRTVELYSKTGGIGSSSGGVINLIDSRYNYKNLIFIYGTEGSLGSIVKTNIELNFLKRLNPGEIRLIESSFGAITVSSIDDDKVTSFSMGEWADNIYHIYGVGVAGEDIETITITFNSNFDLETNYLLKESRRDYVLTDESRDYIKLN